MSWMKTFSREIESDQIETAADSHLKHSVIFKYISDKAHKYFSAEKLVTYRPFNFTVSFLLIHTIIMLICVRLGLWSEYNDPGRYFREGRLITWLSTFQLVFVGYICGSIWNLYKKNSPVSWKDPAGIWKFCAYGFYFLALDEILKIHEALDRYSHKAVGAAITDASDHLDDLIVVFYALAGICALFYYRKEIVRYLGCSGFVAGAFLMSLVSMYLDYLSADRAAIGMLVNDPMQVESYMSWLGVTEEFFKIYAEVFFIAAALYCFQKAVRIKRSDV